MFFLFCLFLLINGVCYFIIKLGECYGRNLEKDELEVMQRLVQLDKDRKEQDEFLSKLDEKQLTEFLVKVYEENENTLKNGEFNVVSGGEL